MDETRALSGEPNRVLAGRYRLQGLVGQGGMADVELAHDDVLDREVAVKILHSRYSDDPAFRERFKREARAAASLNHPNMVAVYDTGDEDGRPFIVMEFVNGRSLKEVLQREGVLPQRAAEMAGDAALALHYAHERGLVHRDVKPANIMVSNEGQVKVTDFGIARAVNAETVTQTAAVFGTAAYIAPEQAQGLDVDARTDVYSLGVVLYEMLTRQQPFSADSAVALAYKHVSEDPVRPTQVNPEISPALEAVVLKAMAKNPANRYQDAREFHDDIVRAARGDRVSAPPVMAYAPTQALRTDRTVVAPAPIPTTEVYDEEPRGNRGFGYVALVLLLLAFFAIAAFLLARFVLAPDPVDQVQVPNVVGQRAMRAVERLESADFTTRIKRVNNDEAAAGIVLSSDPEPGTLADAGSEVVLEVSRGPETVEVPQLVGLTQGEANQLIQQAELSVGTPEQERSDEFERGRIISSDPEAGTEVKRGAPVNYVVSEGPQTVQIPDVRRMAEDDARNALANSCATPPCLNVTVERQFSDEYAEDTAIDTNPTRGEHVDYGSEVVLIVSQGPEPEPSPEPPPPTQPPPATEPTPTEGEVVPAP